MVIIKIILNINIKLRDRIKVYSLKKSWEKKLNRIGLCRIGLDIEQIIN